MTPPVALRQQGRDLPAPVTLREGLLVSPLDPTHDIDPDKVTLPDIWNGLQRLTWLVDGNPRYEIKGLRGELAETKLTVKTLVEQRERMKWIIAGLSVGVTISTFGSLATILPPILTALSSIK